MSKYDRFVNKGITMTRQEEPTEQDVLWEWLLHLPIGDLETLCRQVKIGEGSTEEPTQEELAGRVYKHFSSVAALLAACQLGFNALSHLAGRTKLEQEASDALALALAAAEGRTG